MAGTQVLELMKMRIGRLNGLTRLGLLLLFASSVFAQETGELPRFENYKVRGKFEGIPAKPVLKTRRARLYKTRITEGAKSGPNFAGYFTVVGWGAGLGAFDFAVVDARNGKVCFPPFDYVDASFYGVPNLGDRKNPDFRADSKLFVFYGQKDGESPLGIYHYEFDQCRFRLVKFIRSKTGSEIQ